MMLATVAEALVEGIRVIAGASFLLLAPGLALTFALFPRRSPGVHSRLLLGIGLSLSAVALGSILLNWAGIRLDSFSWTLLAAGVTAAGLLGGAWRWLSVPAADRRLPPLPRISTRSSLLLAAAGLVTVAAIVLSQTPLSARGAQGSTALWLLPGGGAERVQVGVSSSELHATSYRVEVTDRSGSWSVTRRIRLRPGETWRATIRVPSRGRTDHVIARLFVGAARSSSRFASLTLAEPARAAAASR